MPQIKLADLNLSISENEASKLTALLPYWGLSLSHSADIVGSLGQQSINVLSHDPALIPGIRMLLAHTGLTITTNPTEPVDLEVKVDLNHSHKMSIVTNKITYHLKPLSDEDLTDLSQVIYKHIWLPAKTPSTQVILHTNSMPYAEEWMAYLILQYARVEPPPSLTHLSISDYQTLVKKILFSVNPVFANCQDQQIEAERNQGDVHEDNWPEFPPPPVMPQTEELKSNEDITIEENQNNRPLNHPIKEQKNLFEQPSESGPINPFIKKTRESQPFNPFVKKNTSKQPFNPFKKKGD